MEASSDTGSPTTETVEIELSHLKIYRLDAVSPTAESPRTVGLFDQFDDALKIKPRYSVYGPLRFAMPTEKFPAAEDDYPKKRLPKPGPHYLWRPLLKVEMRPGQPAQAFEVEVANQFTKEERFVIRSPTALMVPAAKRHGDREYPVTPGASHFKVYAIESANDRNAGDYWLKDQITVADQGGYAVLHRVLKPKFFAVPCDKLRGDELSPRRGAAHLLIYEITPSADHYKPGKVEARDQFGKYRLSLHTPEHLAVPTVKKSFREI
jgi:hypothetical protein